MSLDSPAYVAALQHRQLQKKLQAQSFSEIQDSSIITPNASRLAIEAFEENQRLLAQIDQMKSNHAAEMRKLRDEYDARLIKLSANEERFSLILKEKNEVIENLQRQAESVDKDNMIIKLNEQIRNLNLQYESLVDSKSHQIERLQDALEKVEFLSEENQKLRNQISLQNQNNYHYQNSSLFNRPYDSPYISPYNSPSRNQQESDSSRLNQTPTQTRSKIGTPRRPPTNLSQTLVNESISEINRESEVIRKTLTPPASITRTGGRRRAPPDHPALAEQIVFGDSNSPKNSPYSGVEMIGLTIDEIKTSLEALSLERMELEKRISKTLPNDRSSIGMSARMQRERDELHLDEVDKMIQRMRLELIKAGSH
ncbi:hypothetical protein TRFO_05827 [Tritrichomonas foetus]|uniref:Uncharacterized protein n=1 Tax=Tritrichomonas foetus TaxID=1144522 RepID=A0A1J4K4C5_9EUKA|nr:hypothetical protein TRFO_05827 [Tritrichomonas foetus]|eukprot:OHT05688.1 hypothetical protein TRFO_05827 [Tritrichomonas foetus]